MEDLLSLGLRYFLMISNPGPSLFLIGGVDAFSYSVILLCPVGGDGVPFGLNRLDTEVDSLRLSCKDTASASSAAICSHGVVVPESAVGAERSETAASSR